MSRTADTWSACGRIPFVGGFVLHPIRNRPGSRPAASVNEPTSPACQRSTGRWPRITSFTIAESSTVRVRAPVTPSAHHRWACGALVTRPRWGLSPNRPQHADGIRIEPPPSPPIATGTMPEATATAEPPLEPPGENDVRHGLRVWPCATDSVYGKAPNSGMAVFPTTIAPASRRRRTTSQSAAAGVLFPRPPNVVTQPATSSSSLIATGTPYNGRRVSP